MSNNKMVTGIFRNTAAAEGALASVLQAGHAESDISVLCSDQTKSKAIEMQTGNRSGTGAGVGAGVGVTAGAVVGALLAVGTSVLLPGFGLIVAGPLAGALAGAGAGGATGTIVGALVGAGIPEHRAKIYESGLREGGMLIGVEVRDKDDEKRVEQIFDDFGARKIRTE